jgi:capsular polysaccharide biosynthesis protein
LLQAAELFEKVELTTVLPDVVVADIPDGRLYTDSYYTIAVITPTNKLLTDLSLELRVKGKLNGFVNNVFNIRWFTKPTVIRGSVFTLLTGGGGLDNYFHWLFDVLPRFHLLQASGLFHQVNWYIIPSYRFPYQIETLKMLGISPAQIIDGSKVTHIQADNIIASSSHRNAGQMEEWVCNFLRESFLDTLPPVEKKYPAYFYISRNDSRSRNVTNEEELIQVLNDFGFTTLSLSGLSFEEQVRLFNSAKIIVSPHGAGLANLVFCQPGTKIIEVFSQGWIGTMYYDLAQKLGLDYYYQIDRTSSPPVASDEAKHKHFAVDATSIKAILEQLIKRKT